MKPAELLPEQLLQLMLGTPGCEPLQEPNASVGAHNCVNAVGEVVGEGLTVKFDVELPLAPEESEPDARLVVDGLELGLAPFEREAVGVKLGEGEGLVVEVDDEAAEGVGELDGVPQGVGFTGVPKGTLAAMTKLSAGLV